MKFAYTLLYVDNVETTISFYEKAFGLKRGFVHESGQYGELVTGQTKLGFVQHQTASSHGFEYEKVKNKPQAFEIGFVVEDVSTSYKIALAAGASGLSEPNTKPWGQVVSYVKDCNGFLIEICSSIE